MSDSVPPPYPGETPVPPPYGSAAPPAYHPGTDAVTFDSDRPAKIARWRPLVHWLLVIPQVLVLYVLMMVAYVLAIVAWFSGVFTGKVPEGVLSVIAMVFRYSARVQVYGLFLREEYPPFSFDATFQDPGDYAGLRFDVAQRVDNRNRLTIFFRYFMIIPHMIVLFFLYIGLYFVVLVGFFAVIITGNWPTGLRNYVVGVLRWSTRVNAYFYLLHDDYPPFSLS